MNPILVLEEAHCVVLEHEAIISSRSKFWSSGCLWDVHSCTALVGKQAKDNELDNWCQITIPPQSWRDQLHTQSEGIWKGKATL